MKELLTDLLEYMELRAEADLSHEGYKPNKEMRFQIRIEEALAKMEKINGPQTEAMWKDEAAQLLPAENTVMWWLCRIADDEVRRKAVVTFDKFPLWDESKQLKVDSIEKAIDSIDWYNEDNENGTYFEGLYRQFIPLLHTPEWKEFLELRK